MPRLEADLSSRQRAIVAIARRPAGEDAVRLHATLEDLGSNRADVLLRRHVLVRVIEERKGMKRRFDAGRVRVARSTQHLVVRLFVERIEIKKESFLGRHLAGLVRSLVS